MLQDDIKTRAGNLKGSKVSINLDSTLTYEERERKYRCEIDIHKPPDFCSIDIIDLLPHGCSSGDTYQIKANQEKTLSLYPNSYCSGKPELLIEVFFLSFKEDATHEIKESFNPEYLLDAKPRFLKAEFQFNRNGTTNMKLFSLGKEPVKEIKTYYEISYPLVMDNFMILYDYLCAKEFLNEVLLPPEPRKGEALFYLPRVYHQCCYLPLIESIFPKDSLSEEILVWTAGEFETEDRSLSRLSLWKKTKKAFFKENFPHFLLETTDDVDLEFLSPEIIVLLLCTFEFDSFHPMLGKHNLPRPVLEIVIKSASKVSYIERALKELKESRNHFLMEI
jgi:hypothetical protein